MLRDTKRVVQKSQLFQSWGQSSPLSWSEGYVHLGRFVPHFGSLETEISVRTCTLTTPLCVLSSASPGKCPENVGAFPMNARSSWLDSLLQECRSWRQSCVFPSSLGLKANQTVAQNIWGALALALHLSSFNQTDRTFSLERRGCYPWLALCLRQYFSWECVNSLPKFLRLQVPQLMLGDSPQLWEKWLSDTGV